MEIETKEIVLGERRYVVRPLPHKQSKIWRRRLRDEIKPLFEQLTGAETAEFSKPSDLLALWPIAEMVIVDGIDAIFELLMAYSDSLENDREIIEETATDKQIMSAFWEVVAITDPFGISRMIARQTGPSSATISSSSQYPNGASPSSGPTPLQSSRQSG